jgi:hypothetical protein
LNNGSELRWELVDATLPFRADRSPSTRLNGDDGSDKKIRRLAQKRGISQGALIVAAVEASLDASGQIDHLTPFIGVIQGAPPSLSESVDDIYR